MALNAMHFTRSFFNIYQKMNKEGKAHEIKRYVSKHCKSEENLKTCNLHGKTWPIPQLVQHLKRIFNKNVKEGQR